MIIHCQLVYKIKKFKNEASELFFHKLKEVWQSTGALYVIEN